MLGWQMPSYSYSSLFRPICQRNITAFQPRSGRLFLTWVGHVQGWVLVTRSGLTKSRGIYYLRGSDFNSKKGQQYKTYSMSYELRVFVFFALTVYSIIQVVFLPVLHLQSVQYRVMSNDAP
jgi:hypothetical protein